MQRQVLWFVFSLGGVVWWLFWFFFPLPYFITIWSCPSLQASSDPPSLQVPIEEPAEANFHLGWAVSHTLESVSTCTVLVSYSQKYKARDLNNIKSNITVPHMKGQKPDSAVQLLAFESALVIFVGVFPWSDDLVLEFLEQKISRISKASYRSTRHKWRAIIYFRD